MATYTEDFAGAAGSLGAPWVQWHQNPAGSNDLKRDGSGHGQAQNAGGADAGVVYNNTIGNDQYSQVQISSWVVTAGVAYVYLLLRSTASGSPDIHDGGTFYWFWSDGVSDTALLKDVANAATTLDTANGTTFAAGDTLKFEAVGSTLKVYKNGVAIVWTTSGVDHVTDSSIASGFPGVGLSVGNTATELIDNWQGGDVTATAGPFVPLPTTRTTTAPAVRPRTALNLLTSTLSTPVVQAPLTVPPIRPLPPAKVVAVPAPVYFVIDDGVPFAPIAWSLPATRPGVRPGIGPNLLMTTLAGSGGSFQIAWGVGASQLLSGGFGS